MQEWVEIVRYLENLRKGFDESYPYTLKQGSKTRGPRPACGPVIVLMRPALLFKIQKIIFCWLNNSFESYLKDKIRFTLIKYVPMRALFLKSVAGENFFIFMRPLSGLEFEHTHQKLRPLITWLSKLYRDPKVSFTVRYFFNVFDILEFDLFHPSPT